METGTVEPMVEIFLEEVSAIVSELEDHIEEGKEKEAFGREQVDEIFRNIHTIKADAAMMLYENIARPARELEKVLYYYRDETNGVTDFEGFLELIEKCLAFVQGELHKLIQGQKPDGDSAELTNDILSYVAEIKGTPKEPFEQEEPEETFFYISSEEEPKEDPKKEEYLPEPYPTGGKEAAREPDKPEEKGAKRPKHILVPVEEMDLLDNINIRLLKYTNLLPPEAQVILRELDSWLWRIHSTDFTLMAAKLDMTVKTMLANVKKDVEFHVLGTELTIEKTKMEKISNAMIHLVRNAVDHGIEMPEERREAGKPLKGHVSVISRSCATVPASVSVSLTTEKGWICLRS